MRRALWIVRDRITTAAAVPLSDGRRKDGDEVARLLAAARPAAPGQTDLFEAFATTGRRT